MNKSQVTIEMKRRPRPHILRIGEVRQTSQGVEIPLTYGLVALVDPADYPRLKNISWRAKRHGRSKDIWYAVGYVGRNAKLEPINVEMHRYILDAKKGQRVDHINRNGLDNRKSNLRFCTPQENNRNRAFENGSSLYKGVRQRLGSDHWEAAIGLNYRDLYLGRFKVEAEAARVYDWAAKILFGPFACFNFPNEEHCLPEGVDVRGTALALLTWFETQRHDFQHHQPTSVPGGIATIQ